MKTIEYRIVAYINDQPVARTAALDSFQEVVVVADKFQQEVEREQEERDEFNELLEDDSDPAEYAAELPDSFLDEADEQYERNREQRDLTENQ